MKTFKQILAIIGIILYVNYIISSPVCVEEYTNRGTSICSEQHMHRQPTVKRNVTKQMQHIPMLVFYFAPKRNDFTFVITNNFYAIVNIPVYHWQLPRGNIISSHLFRFIRHIIGYNANISSWYFIC